MAGVVANLGGKASWLEERRESQDFCPPYRLAVWAT